MRLNEHSLRREWSNRTPSDGINLLIALGLLVLLSPVLMIVAWQLGGS